MVSRSKPPNSSAELAAKAAASAALVPQTESPESKSTHPVSIRLNESEYRRLSTLFAKEGVHLSSGLRMAALWLAEQIESGTIKLTRAGLINRG